MIFDKDALELVKYTPAASQRKFVDMITSKDYTQELLDPTSPFVMLLEANVISTLNAVEESASVSRMLFPSLANSEQDLLHHISSHEEQDLFASPASANITFMINVLDIKSMGVPIVEYNNPDTDVDDVIIGYNVTIPKYTEVIVGGVTLTLFNDIRITMKNIDVYGTKTYSVFVEQTQDDNVLAVNTIGNIYSVITMDTDNIEWVTFETKIQQLKRISYTFNISLGGGFKQNIPITDNYCFSRIYIKNEYGSWVEMNLTHSDVVYDREIPTMKISVLGKSIEYTVPDFYMLDGSMSGSVRIDIYTTVGKMLLPLSKFNINDFKIKLPKELYTEETAGMTKINKIAFSRGHIDGGVTTRTTKELRNKIIFNTTGVIDLPITEKQLNENIKTKGFTLFKAVDTITDRIYIAGKNINDVYALNKLPSNLDVFNNTVSVLEHDISDEGELRTDNVLVNHDGILIKSNTVFKTENGVTKIVGDEFLDILHNNTDTNKSILLGEHEYFYTPFYYVLALDGDSLNSRIYDLDRPKMSYMSIVAKNPIFKANVNISQYAIFKTNTGYRIVLTLFGNKSFEELDPNNIKVQVALKTNNLDSKLIFTGGYDPTISKYTINIDSTFMVDSFDRLEASNGLSDISANEFYIDNDVEFIIYKTSLNESIDETFYPTTEIGDKTINANALCKETAKIKFGSNLTYLWNKITSVYSDRRYKTSTEDVPLRYKADVFNTDVVETNGVVIKNVDCDVATIKFLHKAGDLVLDDAGDIVYEYKIGDVLLGHDGKPILDPLNGVLRYVDILMFQYEYKIVRDVRYDTYVTDIINIILGWLNIDMLEMNDFTLEHTKIYYKPRKSSVSVELLNDKKMIHLTSPTVTLYMDKTVHNKELSYSDLRSSVGKVMHKYVEKKTVILSDIKRDIVNSVANGIVGVSFTDDVLSDAEVLAFKDSSNRLSMKKKYTRFNEVVYDITINIASV